MSPDLNFSTILSVPVVICTYLLLLSSLLFYILPPFSRSTQVLQLWSIPTIPLDLHDGALLMWKRNFALLVEPRFLHIIDHSADLLAYSSEDSARDTYLSESTLGSHITWSVLLSDNQQ
jgi:hypothetical protein